VKRRVGEKETAEKGTWRKGDLGKRRVNEKETAEKGT
jgi:hypothetical protein